MATAKVNTTGLQQLKAKVRTLKEKISIAASLWIIQEIRGEALRGIGLGEPLKQYSKLYQKQKEASGRSKTPNLTWSGKMLGALRSKKNALGGEIYLAGPSSNADKASRNSEKRPFLGVGKKVARSFEQAMQRWLKDFFRKS